MGWVRIFGKMVGEKKYFKMKFEFGHKQLRGHRSSILKYREGIDYIRNMLVHFIKILEIQFRSVSHIIQSEKFQRDYVIE